MGTSIDNPNFRLKAIAELLDGNHRFSIPSYQRGYRWEPKQVEDLLKDIWDFAKSAKTGDFYCLQPVVVKKIAGKVNEGSLQEWEVIDGQQRLSTILLLLKYLEEKSDDAKDSSAILYQIHYQTRPHLNFDSPDKNLDMESYYAFMAKETIEQWFIRNQVKRSKIVEVLFDNYEEGEREPQVKIIWYVVESGDEVKSIRIFNNLNKGKIRLTNAELIKALFVLKSEEKKEGIKTERLILNQLAHEWNEIENQLHDNRFWNFLSNKDYNPATRIDIIFDFLTNKGKGDDADFSYRKFQKLYDRERDELWLVSDEQMDFTEAWEKVKEVYQTFIYWYEDQVLYHYIGYLISIGTDRQTVYSKCRGLPKNQVIEVLRDMIGLNLKSKTLQKETDIDILTYPDDSNDIRKVLLLFNIESYVKQSNKIDSSGTFNRFPFDRFKSERWDIEHVGSQTQNKLTRIDEKIVWLSFIKDITPEDPKDLAKWKEIQKKANALLIDLKANKTDDGAFGGLYDEALSIIQKEDVLKEHTIKNLALLDSGTNRGYGNALFPTKRKIVMNKDKAGVFIPICTRNLFLKFYSQDDTVTSQWKNNWTESDGNAYLVAIHDDIDWAFN